MARQKKKRKYTRRKPLAPKEQKQDAVRAKTIIKKRPEFFYEYIANTLHGLNLPFLLVVGETEKSDKGPVIFMNGNTRDISSLAFLANHAVNVAVSASNQGRKIHKLSPKEK